MEQLHPLTDAQPLWLLPLAGLVALCAVATVLLADRDLSASLLADKDSAAPRTALLGSPVLFALRLSWAAIASWLAATVVAALLYGSLAKVDRAGLRLIGHAAEVQRQPDPCGAAAAAAGRDARLRRRSSSSS